MTSATIFIRRTALAAALSAALGAAPIQAFAAPQPVPGAVFTAKSVITPCDTVNSNIYDDKLTVFLNGGPKGPNGPALPASTNWYVQVTDPSGATVLGSSTLNTALSTTPSLTPVATDAAGKFVKCYRLWDIVSSAPGVTGYGDTPNPGGEYKVWVSEVASFDPSLTKTDNFKVRNGVVPPQDSGRITIRKFYDANANGQYDAGEQELLGWKVDLIDYPIKGTIATYDSLADGNYVSEEYTPVQTNWYPTWVSLNGGPAAIPSNPGPLTLASTTVTLQAATVNDVTVAYGNVCTGAGGGFTLGYWSNQNGQAAMKSMDMTATLAYLSSRNLKNANGSDFDPGNYNSFRSWLLSGNAVNMAYMLSVQLAAMELNVRWSSSVGNKLVYAPGTMSANSVGFASVSALMSEANGLLGGSGTAFPGTSLRNTMEYVKNALDNANNNRTFVQAVPCTYTFNPPIAP